MIPALGRWRQEGQKLGVILGYMLSRNTAGILRRIDRKRLNGAMTRRLIPLVACG